MENVDRIATTPEKIWELLMENARQMAESRAESEQYKKEWDEKFERERAESLAKFERDRAEYNKRSADLDRRIKEVNEAVNGIGKSNGMFAEEFFYTSIDKGDKKIFGELFDEYVSYEKRHNKAKNIRGEQDIILSNNESVALIEIKYRARKDDVQKMIDKLPNFRKLYPQHDSRRIYLGIAAMSFDKGVEEECSDSGIAIVKQVGDTVVINDEYLKVF